MPKIKMDKVRHEEVWVEIPEKCPECGVSFMETDPREDNHLEEQRWVGYAQDCYLEHMDEKGEFVSAEMGDIDKNIYEMDLVFAYMCRNCDAVIADTTEEGQKYVKAEELAGRDPSSRS